MIRDDQSHTFNSMAAVAYASPCRNDEEALRLVYINRAAQERFLIFPDQRSFDPKTSVSIEGSNEGIESIDLHPSTTSVQLGYNELRKFRTPPSLKSAYVNSNKIRGVLCISAVAEDYNFSFNQIETVEFPLKALVKDRILHMSGLNLNSNKLKSLTIPEHVHINVLNCSGNPLERLTIKGKVDKIICKNSSIKELNVNEGTKAIECEKNPSLGSIYLPSSVDYIRCDNILLKGHYEKCRINIHIPDPDAGLSPAQIFKSPSVWPENWQDDWGT